MKSDKFIDLLLLNSYRERVADSLRRYELMLPPRSRLTRPRHPRHLPRAPVRKDRAVLHHRARQQQIMGDARRDDLERRRVQQTSRNPIPRSDHRLRRAQQRGRQEVRLGGVVPGLTCLPRARLLLKLSRLPVTSLAHPIRTDQEDERGGQVRSHAQRHYVRHDQDDLRHLGE